MTLNGFIRTSNSISGSYSEVVESLNKALKTLINENLKGMNLEVQYVNKTTLGLNYDNITVYEKNNTGFVKEYLTKNFNHIIDESTDKCDFFILQLADTGNTQATPLEVQMALEGKAKLELPQLAVETNLINKTVQYLCPSRKKIVRDTEVIYKEGDFAGALVCTKDNFDDKTQLYSIAAEIINTILLHKLFRHGVVDEVDKKYLEIYKNKQFIVLDLHTRTVINDRDFTQFNLSGVTKSQRKELLQLNLEGETEQLFGLSTRLETDIILDPNNTLPTPKYKGVAVFVVSMLDTRIPSIIATLSALGSLSAIANSFRWVNLAVELEEKNRTLGSYERIVNSLGREKPAIIDLSSTNFSKEDKVSIITQLFHSDGVVALEIIPHSANTNMLAPLFKIANNKPVYTSVFNKIINIIKDNIRDINANVTIREDELTALFRVKRRLHGYFIDTDGIRKPLSYIDETYLLSNNYPIEVCKEWVTATNRSDLYTQNKILSTLNSVVITGVRERLYIPSSLIVSIVKAISANTTYELNGVQFTNVPQGINQFEPFDYHGYAINSNIDIFNRETVRQSVNYMI
jgi:hypothetical protein